MLDKALFKQMQNLSKKKKDAGNERVSNARHIWAVVVAHLVEQSDARGPWFKTSHWQSSM